MKRSAVPILLTCLVLAMKPVAEPAADSTAAVPDAKSVDLGKPVSEQELLESAATQRLQKSALPEPGSEPLYAADSIESEIVYADTLPDIHLANSLLLLGAKVPPGMSTRLAWSPNQSFEGISVPTPVLVVNGAENGPTLCLTAAIHGDELNGIEIIRRVLYNLDPQELSGAVVGVPIVNLEGFRRGERYMTDRRDLNRFFPGNPNGSSAARIAYSFFKDVVSHCDVLVDLHTGSFYRTNMPQLRADLRNPAIVELTHGFGSTVVLHSEGTEGTLRRAATEKGIPSLTLEAGAPMRLEEESVRQGVAGIETLLSRMNMLKSFKFWGNPEPVYYQSNWVRADLGGILLSSVSLGQSVNPGQLLGTVTDPITNVSADIVSPHAGRVLGMALNQVVLPGFAAYHLGVKPSEQPDVQKDSEHLLEDDDVASNTDEVPEDDFAAE